MHDARVVIRKTAEICEIHRNTAFNWRHKILDALQDIEDNVVLDGIVEADETFFAISYKGNHSNGGSFTMPRKPHKRGKEIHTRGLSKEQVCVACAVNRNGKSIGKVSNLGRISTKNVEDVLGDRIDENSTLVTDEMNAYVKFAKNRGINLVQIKGGKSKKGIYNVQRANSYHSSLSRFMLRFQRSRYQVSERVFGMAQLHEVFEAYGCREKANPAKASAYFA